MSSILLDDDVMTRLRERNPRFHETAYVFILSSLQFVLERLPEPRHITGRELTEGARDLAIERFGRMARSVLEYWGIHDTGDLGRLVFALVDCGILIRQDEDRLEDFLDVFDFDEAFERDYPWAADV